MPRPRLTAVFTLQSLNNRRCFVNIPAGRRKPGRPVIACPNGQYGTKNETPKKGRGDRRQNGAPIAKFRTRRPAHICETSRYRAVFERPSYVRRWRRTGWLGRQDSNLCILESEFAKTLSPGGGTRTCASRIKGAPDRRLDPVEAG